MDELSTEDKAAFEQMKADDKALGSMEEPESRETPIPEPETAPEPKPESAPTPEPVKQPESEDDRKVPLKALQEERAERRAAQERAEAAQARMEAILAKISPPEPEKTVPAPEQDPIGNLKAVNEELRQLREYRQQQEAITQQTEAQRSIMQAAIAQEAEYVKADPDYNDAGNYLRTQRTNQLLAMGYNQQQALEAVKNESIALARDVLARGGNVPETLKKLAVAGGYTKKAAASTEETKLDTVAKGMRSNTSLSNVSGIQQKTGELNAKAILAMDDNKFNEYLSKLSRADRIAVLGQ